MRLSLTNFSKGLWVLSGKETTLQGFMRRARGVHELRTPSLRSRLGSTQLFTTDNVNSIVRFNNFRYFATTAGVLYNEGVSIKTGLSGAPIRFLKMPPQSGLEDYLFYLDSNGHGKVSQSDVVTGWGIASPAGNFTAATNGAGALTGVYQYYVTYKNSVTGSRSNPNPTAQSVTAASNQLRLTGIPTSADAQVDTREIWRTTSGGARFFKVSEIGDNVTTTFNDNNADSALQSLEIQFDNAKPNAGFVDVWMSSDQRVWWIDSNASNGGRAYYTPPGRPESMRGFISLCGTDEFLTKGISWNGINWIFSVSRLFRINGDDEPFTSTPIDGVPGCALPWTVKATPYGIVYLSYDGLYLFNGNRADLLGFDEIAPIFRGESVENLGEVTYAFDPPTRIEYAKNELFLMDGAGSNGTGGQLLALNLKTLTWRDLGLSLRTIYKEPDSRNIVASFLDNVYLLEDFDTVTDGGNTIAIEWEVGGALSDIAHVGTITRLYVDINTSNVVVTVTLITDNTTVTVGTITNNARAEIELPVPNTFQARVFSIRLTASANQRVELFGLAVDVKLEGSNKDVGVG